MPKVPVSNFKRGKSSAAGLRISAQWKRQRFCMVTVLTMGPCGSRWEQSCASVRQLSSTVSSESWPGCMQESPRHTSLPSELGCFPNPYTNYPELENSGFCLQETIKPQGSQRFPSALARAASISAFNHISRDSSALECSPATFLSPGQLPSLWDTLTGQDPHQALQGLLCCCLLLLLSPGGFRHCW